MAAPLLTKDVHDALLAGSTQVSLDLGRSRTTVEPSKDGWSWQGRRFPYMEACKERTVYHWSEESFQPVQRFTRSLIKLVPT